MHVRVGGGGLCSVFFLLGAWRKQHVLGLSLTCKIDVFHWFKCRLTEKINTHKQHDKAFTFPNENIFCIISFEIFLKTMVGGGETPFPQSKKKPAFAVGSVRKFLRTTESTSKRDKKKSSSKNKHKASNKEMLLSQILGG